MFWKFSFMPTSISQIFKLNYCLLSKLCWLLNYSSQPERYLHFSKSLGLWLSGRWSWKVTYMLEIYLSFLLHWKVYSKNSSGVASCAEIFDLSWGVSSKLDAVASSGMPKFVKTIGVSTKKGIPCNPVGYAVNFKV